MRIGPSGIAAVVDILNEVCTRTHSPLRARRGSETCRAAHLGSTFDGCVLPAYVSYDDTSSHFFPLMAALQSSGGRIVLLYGWTFNQSRSSIRDPCAKM